MTTARAEVSAGMVAVRLDLAGREFTYRMKRRPAPAAHEWDRTHDVDALELLLGDEDLACALGMLGDGAEFVADALEARGRAESSRDVGEGAGNPSRSSSPASSLFPDDLEEKRRALRELGAEVDLTVKLIAGELAAERKAIAAELEAVKLRALMVAPRLNLHAEEARALVELLELDPLIARLARGDR